ncbi:mechanosensitive ion channel domain-containing protein [Komagataeibacter rhaeticus]
MLVENAMQVGDWVTAGSVAGTVEHLSIRTLRLRAINGDLHIIPFSSVTSIANTSRDYNLVVVSYHAGPRAEDAAPCGGHPEG